MAESWPSPAHLGPCFPARAIQDLASFPKGSEIQLVGGETQAVCTSPCFQSRIIPSLRLERLLRPSNPTANPSPPCPPCPFQKKSPAGCRAPGRVQHRAGFPTLHPFLLNPLLWRAAGSAVTAAISARGTTVSY